MSTGEAASFDNLPLALQWAAMAGAFVAAAVVGAMAYWRGRVAQPENPTKDFTIAAASLLDVGPIRELQAGINRLVQLGEELLEIVKSERDSAKLDSRLREFERRLTERRGDERR